MTIEADNQSPVGRALRVALRILLVALIGIGLGAAAYFGVPFAYRQLVEPVQDNSARLDSLAQELEQARTELSDLADRSDGRIADLEAANAANKESLAELQAKSDLDQTEFNQQLDQLTARLDELEQALSAQADAIDQALATPTAPDPELVRQLAVNRALLHLLRARQSMFENNLGLAAAEVQQARAALADLEGMEPAIARLDQALVEFAATPLVAGDDLEAAWRLLTAADSQSSSPTAEPLAPSPTAEP